VVCRPGDKELFEEVGLHNEFENDDEHLDYPGAVLLVGEVNYALAGELNGLRKAGVPFVFWNDAGCSYGPGACAFDGKDFAEAELNHDLGVVVPVDDGGVPVSADVENARRYLEVVRRVKEMFLSGSERERRERT